MRSWNWPPSSWTCAKSGSSRCRKLRGSGFRTGQHGYRLTSEGLQLFPRLADVPPADGYQRGDQRIPSGIPALDSKLAGGLLAGTSTMVVGPSGSGKTLMGLHFIFGGVRHGEPGVIATLQENPTQLERTAGSLGWALADPAVEVMYRSPWTSISTSGCTSC